MTATEKTYMFDDTELTLRHTAGNAPGDETGAEYVDAAITSRKSVRGFTDQPVSLDLVKHLLAVASRAPSGTNMQPWKVYVLTGATKERLTERILHAKENDAEALGKRTWKYYPDEFPPVYKARRRKIGWDMYGLAGIEKGEREKAEKLRNRNFHFFGAPVGMIFTIDDELEVGSWIDYGFFLEAIAVAARGRGLHTCAQAIFADVPGAVTDVLPIPETEIIVCGMSLGYIDDSVDVNALETERAPVEEFAKFFED